MERGPAAIRFRLAALAALVPLALVAVVFGPTSATAVSPQTVFVNDGFTTGSVTNYLKLSLSTGGTNHACLTASSATSQTPVPGCGGSTDASGSGALRLTSSSPGNQVGALGSTQSIPINKGLDAVFNMYQFSSASSGGDGMSFYLAVTDPLNPSVPSTTGYSGGALGYAPYVPSSRSGLAYGYLGFGFDTFGNYATSSVDGSGCSAGAPAFAHSTTQNAITVRGPSNSTTGYCILSGPVVASGGSLRADSATRASSQVPVEVLINPSTTSSTSAVNPAITVLAGHYKVIFTVGGTQQQITGPLPHLSSTTFPSSWFDPVTGYPYKLTYGWAAGTGGATDNHEINSSQSQTINGPVPTLSAVASAPSSLLGGNSGAITITPTVTSSGGDEGNPIIVTTTFPAGLTPTAASSSPWVCSLAGQVSTCTYTPTGPIPAGTTLSSVALPFTASSTTGVRTISYVVSSIDATAVSNTRDVTVTNATISGPDVSGTLGSTATFSATVSPAPTTGSVTFTDQENAATLCTASTNVAGLFSCTATLPANADSHTVSATYSGGTAPGPITLGPAQSTLLMSVSKAGTSFTEAATPSSISVGSPATLSISGLAGSGTGTVDFRDAASTLICTIALPATSCATPLTLGAGAYALTASYSGDANYLASTSTGATLVVVATSQLSLPAPTDTTSTSFMAHWPAVPGAAAYRVDVSTDPSFGSFLPGYSSLNVGLATQLAVTGLSPGKTYYFRVVALGPASVQLQTMALTATTSQTTLPLTGTDVGSLGLIALLLSSLGAGVTIVSRRRRRLALLNTQPPLE